MCKVPADTQRAVGLWNHVLIIIQNPLCPTPLAPKEMLQGGFGDFVFLRNARWMALASTTMRDAAETTRGSRPKGSKGFVELPLRADIHWRKGYGAGGRLPRKQESISRFPANSLLLLPPNNKEILKPEAFASSCLHPCS
jgi:hypothetical protein